MTRSETDWFPHSLDSSLPMYRAIVDAIERDIVNSVLWPGDKLPPQRVLAARLDIDFTTVSRAYNAAKKKGLVVARIGQGTFINDQKALDGNGLIRKAERKTVVADMAMNMPPLPQDVSLRQRMKQEMADTALSMYDQQLFGYQDFFGTVEERTIAANWMQQRIETSAEQVLICSGTQSTLLALLRHLVGSGTSVCSENLCYPGFSAAAKELNIRHIGLEMDDQGIVPEAFAKACEDNRVAVLYCTTTQHNPTTITWPHERREAIAQIAKRYHVQIIEDDAYGFLHDDGLRPLSSYLPEQSYYIAGLAKCLSSALRVTFLSCPERSSMKGVADVLRATSLMASPLTRAMAAALIKSGCADQIRKGIEEAAVARQKLVRQILHGLEFKSHPYGFHIWLTLPSSWSQADFIDRMREHAVRLVSSEVFSLKGETPQQIRLCLGAIEGYERTRDVLMVIEDLLKGETGYSGTIV